MIRWFQTWLRQKTALTGQTAPGKTSEENKAVLIDLAHEVLSKEAAEKKESLKGLEKFGWPFFQRRKKRQMIKDKVRKTLDLPVTQEDGEEMVEEITEKIAEVCEADPEMARLFNDQNLNK